MTSSGKIIAPGDIQNRSRTLWLPATTFIVAVTGTPVLNAAVLAGATPAWALDAAAVEDVTSSVVLPSDTVDGDVTLTVYWSVANANAGNVVWMGLTRLVAPGGGALSSDVLGPVTAAAPGVTGRVVATVLSTNAFSSLAEAAGKFSQIYISRNGNDAADTYASDVYFLGVLLTYTADM